MTAPSTSAKNGSEMISSDKVVPRRRGCIDEKPFPDPIVTKSNWKVGGKTAQSTQTRPLR